jgi:hypothetical protein
MLSIKIVNVLFVSVGVLNVKRLSGTEDVCCSSVSRPRKFFNRAERERN